ncbi:MAG: bifunctional N-acetylglucosamine-1-phosphate uridyltransferase/glucosamine-1-phosphate acetyltransferase [Candidatus Mcinerneyibacterium aminivorans]|uniref:Bifunctional N-acetylglucosamine-1-phosphate uridyltransferase/glucosamine-1-phosphate acetyltransferase n=1 Tax=Candidatus Mcinerneyibacterium aminivorans TaxID=2703815 RepID=A0A5D0MI00_9BACT|nr:MAG: bifunctional N-acetylglucosamine-1-phosphate uridyltransferase/glucosamine-1-phosphate acetyltransferase [Candidatus Mcinerneyibacterium aminivorans]
MLGVILAAGKGTRMKSEKPKVLFEVCGRSMIKHIYEILEEINIKNKSVIYGYKGELIKKELEDKGCYFFEQKKQLGTGHALKQVDFKNFKNDEFVMVLPGDVPLLDFKKMHKFIDFVKKNDLDAGILTTEIENPTGYGRIIRNKKNLIEGIVEQKDATEKQRKINEINTGVYIIKKRYTEKYLDELENNNKQNEYYLTDIFKLMIEDDLYVDGYKYKNSQECIGVNSRYHLSKANNYYKNRYLKELMKKGVTINNPDSVILEGELICDSDVEIKAPVYIKDYVEIKSNSTVGPYVYLENCKIDKNSSIEFKYINKDIRKNILVQEGE